MRFSVVFTIIICVVLAVSAIVYLRQSEVVSPLSPEPSKSSPQVVSKPQIDTPTSPSADSPKEVQAPDDSQNDVEFGKQAQNSLDDLWASFRSQDTEVEDEETADKKEETKIDPRTINFNFNSPDAYEFIRGGLVEKYGDTPEVQAYMEGWLKRVSGPTTLEDSIRHAEAGYALNPHPQTYRSLQLLKAAAAGDTETLMQHAEPVNRQTEKFADVLPFFEKNSHAEAFRKLRTADPKRAIEFENFILDQAIEDPSLDIEKIVHAIERSYETPLNNK